MKELEQLCKGFEAGVAFAVRHGRVDISHLITQLSVLRTWKTYEEWQEFVMRNIVEDEDGQIS